MINGGTSGKGSGLGWMVGDNGLIFQWDGFSWTQSAVAPATTCQLNSVNFGGPLNPLTSITSAAGWGVGGFNPVGGPGCVGGGGFGGFSMFFNGISWVAYKVPTPTPATTELRGVFLVRGGPAGTDVQAYAVGTESGADGAFWVWNGVPGSGGGWLRCQGVCGGPFPLLGPVNSLYMTQCTGTPCTATDGVAVGNSGTVYRFVGGSWVCRHGPVGCTNPSLTPPGVNLNGVAMSSQSVGWAVGDSCTIISTTNGDTWYGPFSSVGCTASLRSIVMLSSSEAYAVGDADALGVTIVHGTSLDSAPTWRRIDVSQIALTVPAVPPPGPGLNSVTFAPSGGNLWAAGVSGAAAFCLSDCSSVSGAIWSTTTSPVNAGLNSVFMVSDSDGWAVGDADAAGNPTILRWNGGSFSWTKGKALPSISPTSLFGVHLASGSSGWAVGGASPTVPSVLWYDGNTWTGKPVFACGCFLDSVYMVSDSNSWAVGSGGVIMHSTSPGGGFSAPVTVGTDLYSVAFDPTSGGVRGWAVGGDGFGVPITVHTLDSGATWPSVPNPAPAGVILKSVFFQDSTHGWAAGDGSTILYWDGAWHLVPIVVNLPFTGPLDLFHIEVLGGPPATDGWAVGVDALGLPVAVHYDIGTNTWSTLLTPSIPPPGILFGMSLRSGTNGLAVGSQIFGSTSSLDLVLHLDPPGGVSATTSTSSTPTSSTTSAASTTSSISTSTSSTPITTSSMTTTVVTNSLSSSVMTTTAVSTPTTSTTVVSTSTSSVSTPMTLPPIPGFPLESILAGVIIGMVAVAIIRRRRRCT